MAGDGTGAQDARKLLEDALSLWWLRPENGLSLASYCLRGGDLKPAAGEAAADFACGDGVNTFFKCGGRFGFDFDIFGVAVSGSKMADVLRSGEDVFDHSDERYALDVASRPGVRYAVGTDHKANLLSKAEALGFYDRLVEADLREPADIADESLDLAYCNSIYWIEDPKASLGHIARKVRSGGRIVMDVMTDHRSALDFAKLFPAMPSAWSEAMNRGRQKNNPGILNETGWDDVFSSHGCEIVAKRDIFPTAIAQLWNVGLRPAFPALNRLASAVDVETRRDIKREWVDGFVELLAPVLVDPDALIPSGPAVRLQYELRRV